MVRQGYNGGGQGSVFGKLGAKRGALRTAKELSRAKGKGVYIHCAEQHRPCAINLIKEG